LSFLSGKVPQDWRRFGGLEPQAWLCVGPGYSREELKTRLLGLGIGLSGNSVLDVLTIATRVLASRGREFRSDRILSAFARQELLGRLLQKPALSSKCPELKRLKRSRSFLGRLDHALQSGRRGFAHSTEEQVLEERLQERVGESLLRAELKIIARDYEQLLDQHQFWDEVRVLREATEVLEQSDDLGDSTAWPEEIWVARLGKPEPLEDAFWSRLSERIPIQWVSPEDLRCAWETTQSIRAVASTAAPVWERWHTLDDAAEALAEDLQALADPVDRVAVVIPDLPAVRRSVVRALSQAGVPLADPRDPTRLKWDEGIKWALSPLGVVARNFEREAVVSWLEPRGPQDVRQIYARGIRDGLSSYAGGELEGLHARLCELSETFGGKRTLEDLSQRHLKYLSSATVGRPDRIPTLQFFEKLWKAMVADHQLLSGVASKRADRPAPLRYWLERLMLRLSEGSPPVDYARPRQGVHLYRLSQAPIERYSRVEFVALPTDWLDGDADGDYWFSAREREVLGQEFGLGSGEQTRQDREQALRLWLSSASEARIRDAQYEWDGRERESLVPLLTRLGLQTEGQDPIEVQDKGSHPRWQPSYGPTAELPNLEICLGPDPARVSSGSGKPEVRATELDRYTRCAFQALGNSRWRLYDLRMPEPDLWPDQRGNVLHRAAQLLLESRDPDLNFQLLPAQALEQAWEDQKPMGLIRGKRLGEHAKKRLIPVLESFCEAEREYARRSGARVHSLEGPELRAEFGGVAVIGRPDRIDEHPDGFFVLDYKSSSSLAKGRQMIDLGYRLQLPFYALAAQRQLGKPAIGVQFVELNRTAGRSQGIFFKKWNGKNPGCLTATTARSTSLVPEEPQDAWSKIEEQITRQLKDYVAGRFIALPKDAKECDSCSFMDLCGLRRKGETA
jgi:RecB family exonuclease